MFYIKENYIEDQLTIESLDILQNHFASQSHIKFDKFLCFIPAKALETAPINMTSTFSAASFQDQPQKGPLQENAHTHQKKEVPPIWVCCFFKGTPPKKINKYIYIYKYIHIR